MSYTNKFILVLLAMAFACFTFSFYLSKYHKDPMATVQLVRGGCFGYSSFKLSLLHGNTSIVARLDSGGKVIAQRRISKAQMDSFDVFIADLIKMKNGGGCTSYRFYTVHYKDRIIKREDWSCEWFKFQRLLVCFFGSDDKINFV